MDKSRHDKHPLHHCKFLQQSRPIAPAHHLLPSYHINPVSLLQESNGTVSVANTLSGHIILAERLNYEERTRYLVLVQANVSEPNSVSRLMSAQYQDELLLALLLATSLRCQNVCHVHWKQLLFL